LFEDSLSAPRLTAQRRPDAQPRLFYVKFVSVHAPRARAAQKRA
jgi:hypothetical protein